MSLFWQTVLSNSAVASALTVVALVVGRFPRRAAVAHLVWLGALAKLLTPPLVVFEVPALAARAIPPAAPVGPTPSIDPARTLLGPAPERFNPPGSNESPIGVHAVGNRPEAWSWSWDRSIGVTWAALSLGVATIAALRLGAFRGQLRRWPVAPAEVRDVAADLAGRLGLARVPEIRVAPGVLPPLVWSLGGPPVVVLPARLVETLGSDELGAILAHELAHVRRGDHRARFLELACVVALPWHPLVWLAIPRLRDLEEACSDAMALQMGPGRPRAYALALVATLEFLGGRRGPAVPLRTAIRPAHPLARRITMLSQTPPRRLTPASLTLVASLVAAPLALTFAQGPAPAPAPTPTTSPAGEVRTHSIIRSTAPPPAEPAIVRGRVVDKAGAPVADVRVRLATVSAREFWQIDWADGGQGATTRPPVREARTDAQGNYRFELPEIVAKTEVSLDALKPGFRRVVSGAIPDKLGEEKFEAGPGRTIEIPLVLDHPTRYFRGIVVDEAGRTIPGVRVAQYFDFIYQDNKHALSGGGPGQVRPDGSFELFNVDLEPHRQFTQTGTNFVLFEHPDYAPGRIDDLDSVPDADRENLRIVLKAGRSVGGTVLDTAGKPVADALVAAEYSEGFYFYEKRKATRTDEGGRFRLRGLSDGLAEIKVKAYPIKERQRLPLPTASTDHLTIRLRPLGLPADLRTYDVLGMKLADVTPAVREAYDLFPEKGAVIVDQGLNPARLGIGTLAEGNCFTFVGGGRPGDSRHEGEIANVRDLVTHLVAGAARDDNRESGVRVVYYFADPESMGTMTDFLKLTPDDLKALQALADRLAK